MAAEQRKPSPSRSPARQAVPATAGSVVHGEPALPPVKAARKRLKQRAKALLKKGKASASQALLAKASSLAQKAAVPAPASGGAAIRGPTPPAGRRPAALRSRVDVEHAGGSEEKEKRVSFEGPRKSPRKGGGKGASQDEPARGKARSRGRRGKGKQKDQPRGGKGKDSRNSSPKGGNRNRDGKGGGPRRGAPRWRDHWEA